jgi:hydrogenase maturation factor
MTFLLLVEAVEVVVIVVAVIDMTIVRVSSKALLRSMQNGEDLGLLTACQRYMYMQNSNEREVVVVFLKVNRLS